MIKRWLGLGLLLTIGLQVAAQQAVRTITPFNKGWKFLLGDEPAASVSAFDDSKWRLLTLPHDWSIEGSFSKDNPAKPDGGALPTGTGWYRKSFSVPMEARDKLVYIEFDGVYRNSEVWINGHRLGMRPNGYISFRYDLTPYLNWPSRDNVIAVKVDNSEQPASRWYGGSGIYRNVRLVTTSKIAVDQWGTFITTPQVSSQSATIRVQTTIKRAASLPKQQVALETTIFDAFNRELNRLITPNIVLQGTDTKAIQELVLEQPKLWSVDAPYLYKAVTRVMVDGKPVDNYTSTFGVRSFFFNAEKGFFLNGQPLKILGVCNHHDLGALGTAVNTRAIERQLEILKKMGCNAIRTSHNPPAPELLDACDKMGFIVMDEAFDMWAKKKNKFDYHLNFPEWHRRDLQDQVLRDRNHPSVFMWSIGNEIREQFDTSGIRIGRELVALVKELDTTRVVTCALSENDPAKNYIYQSGALDLIGLNYHHEAYADFPKNYPGQKFIGSENMSALATRGHYDMPSTEMRFWPKDSKEKFVTNNPDYTVSAYDQVAAYWGSTHETTWKIIKKYDFLSGLFVWTGFDYLGEPVPYPWPARSSYYGIIDLAGFPKDVYYMYQSEWTKTPVLHLLPHWNWEKGKTIDVWAYYSNADEVELYLNGRSLGKRSKKGDDLHVMWSVKYQAGTLKAISRKNSKTVLTQEIKTAGKPARIELEADRKVIKADGTDLSFVTVRVLDAKGNPVPDADNLINFSVTGDAAIAGVDNGYQASMEPFKAHYRKLYNGKCLVIVQAGETNGAITLEASGDGLKKERLQLTAE